MCTSRLRNLALAAALSAAAAFSLPQDAAAQGKGVIETGRKAFSPALGREISFSVYRPSEPPPPGQRWPVLYLLHGMGGGDEDWLRFGHIAATLDKGVAEGRFKPMMIVMPAAGDSWYIDDTRPGGFGRVATALGDDLIDIIDAAYPTARCREGRSIAGISMGGYGAILYAFDHPDMFGSVISLSGSVFSRAPDDQKERGVSLEVRFAGVFGSPFSWENYMKWSVFPRAEKLAPRADKPAVWLSAGDDDYPSILEGNMDLHLLLRKHGFQTELRIDNAKHAWSYWSAAIQPALEWLSPRLNAACPTSPAVKPPGQGS